MDAAECISAPALHMVDNKELLHIHSVHCIPVFQEVFYQLQYDKKYELLWI